MSSTEIVFPKDDFSLLLTALNEAAATADNATTWTKKARGAAEKHWDGVAAPVAKARIDGLLTSVDTMKTGLTELRTAALAYSEVVNTARGYCYTLVDRWGREKADSDPEVKKELLRLHKTEVEDKVDAAVDVLVAKLRTNTAAAAKLPKYAVVKVTPPSNERPPGYVPKGRPLPKGNPKPKPKPKDDRTTKEVLNDWFAKHPKDGALIAAAWIGLPKNKATLAAWLGATAGRKTVTSWIAKPGSAAALTAWMATPGGRASMATWVTTDTAAFGAWLKAPGTTANLPIPAGTDPAVWLADPKNAAARTKWLEDAATRESLATWLGGTDGATHRGAWLGSPAAQEGLATWIADPKNQASQAAWLSDAGTQGDLATWIKDPKNGEAFATWAREPEKISDVITSSSETVKA